MDGDQTEVVLGGVQRRVREASELFCMGPGTASPAGPLGGSGTPWRVPVWVSRRLGNASVFSIEAGFCTHFTMAGSRGRTLHIQMFGATCSLGRKVFSVTGTTECFKAWKPTAVPT